MASQLEDMSLGTSAGGTSSDAMMGSTAPEPAMAAFGRVRRPLLPAISPMALADSRDFRSRSPTRVAPPERAQADQAAIQASPPILIELIDKELGNVVSDAVKKDIKTEAEKLSRRIRSLQKTNTRIIALESELNELAAGRLPRTVRAATMGFESEHLDDLAVALGVDTHIDETKSVREEKQRIHLEHAKVQKQLDLQVVKTHRLALKSSMKKVAFVERCLQSIVVRGGTNPSAAKSLDMDSDEDEQFEGRQDVVLRATARIVAVYIKVVEAEAEAKRIADKKVTEEAKNAESFAEKIAKKTPEEYILETIAARLAKGRGKGKGGGKGKNKGDSRYVVDYTKLATAALQGTEVTALVAAQHITTNDAKASGKGKGKPEDKKGGGKGKEKGKGKGKGKEKSFPEFQKSKSNPKGRGKGKGQKGKDKDKGKEKVPKNSWYPPVSLKGGKAPKGNKKGGKGW